MTQLYIGIAKCDISPEKKIAGRLGLHHLIEPFDPIFAKAVAFKNKDVIVINISCEIVGLTDSLNKKIKKIITDKIDIKSKNIIITATHTHSSPWVWDIQSEEAEKFGFEVLDKQWIKKVILNTAKAGINAYNDLSEGEISYGIAQTEGIVSNRVFPVTRWSITEDDKLRNSEVGLVDDHTRVIIVKNTSKTAFLANLACHPSAFGGGKTLKVSPDYPYYTELLLQEKYNIEFLTYWQGCAGNSNSGKFVKYGTIDEVRKIAVNFAKAIGQAVDNSKDGYSDISYSYKKHNIKVGDFVKSPKEARESFAVVSKELIACKDRGQEITDKQVFDWRAELKKLDVSIISNGENIDIELQVINFGDLALLFVPGEWYIENYIKIADLFPTKQVVITTLNTFDLLYVPDESNFDKHDWYGVRTSMRVLGDEGVKIMINKAIEILRQ